MIIIYFTSSVDIIPRTGRRITGRSAVTGRGVAFILHIEIDIYASVSILRILRISSQENAVSNCLPLSPKGLPSEEEETPYGPRRELYKIAE